MTDNWTPNGRSTFQAKRKPPMKPPKKEPKVNHFEPSPCISCGSVNDTATGATDMDAAPVPGDIMICLDCGHIAAYGDDMRVRELTEKEQILVAGDRAVLHAQRLRKAFQREGKP